MLSKLSTSRLHKTVTVIAQATIQWDSFKNVVTTASPVSLCGSCDVTVSQLFTVAHELSVNPQLYLSICDRWSERDRDQSSHVD